MLIFLRKAVIDDLNNIMAIIDDAKKLLKADNSSQWQNGTPNRDMFINDINNDSCYVLVVDGDIAGVTTVLNTPDPNYKKIYNGSWIQQTNNYATFHRIAISSKYRGKHFSDFLFSTLITTIYEMGYRDIRIDTHRLNKRMQHIIEKWNFKYCGIVKLPKNVDLLDNTRLTYELVLK